ncbi:uncharacterized protein KIAA1143 homolog [Tachysurus ichikawai]
MNKKGNVSWVKPSEPSFLRKFKNDIGYKEGPTVETKRQELPQFDDDSGDSDREDEMPQVVVLKKGDITAEEALQLKKDVQDSPSNKDEKPPADGKILFKKPAKRSSDKFEGITASSNSKKKKKNENEEEEEEKKKESGVKVKNRSLLSFGDDEEED